MPGRILVLDMDVTNRLTLKTALTAEYFDVVTTDREHDLVRTVLREQVDAVIVSARLKMNNGYNVCWKLKQNPLCANIPVMILAGSNELNWKRGLGSRADDMVALPFNRKNLAERLNRLCKQKSEIEALRVHAQSADSAGLNEAAWRAPSDRLPQSNIVILTQNEPLAKNLARHLRTDIGATVFMVNSAEQLPPPEPSSLLIILSDRGFEKSVLHEVSVVKASPKLRNWPIMTLTSGRSNEYTQQAKALGCEECIFGLENIAHVSMRARSLLWAAHYIGRLRASLVKNAGATDIDALTGLHNAKYANAYVDRAIGWTRDPDHQVAVVLFSLDNFQQVNDTMGHPTGETVLREFASLLRNSLRGADVVARLGGATFMLGFKNVDPKRVVHAAEHIRHSVLATRFSSFHGHSATRLTVSAGIASTGNNLVNGDALMSAAEAALRRAKDAGRNQVATFDQLAA